MLRPKAEIIEKLAKMVRHEQGARDIGSIAEAEAFASQVQTLLTKHGLEMSEIEFEEQASEPIDLEWAHTHHDDSSVPYETRRVEWQEELAEAIARNNNCALLITQHCNSVCFVGRPSDRSICLSLYRYFTRLALDLAEKAAKDNRDEQREKCKARNTWGYSGATFRWWMVSFKKSFCCGFSHSICMKFYEQARAMEKTAETQPEASTALIHLRNNREAC
jgi:hypothetical protein